MRRSGCARRGSRSAFAIGVGTTSKIVDRLEKEGWLAGSLFAVGLGSLIVLVVCGS
ncbi:hypothetical protein ABTX61_11340 [Amycolatopsis japonica]|uniref:hypothetical protein n=1 Tax=Amycolatopsis japonica TaxID=208439 RepID=UPI0033314C2C